MYRLIWVFRNDHQWEKSFDTAEEAWAYAESIGLPSNPDIKNLIVSGRCDDCHNYCRRNNLGA